MRGKSRLGSLVLSGLMIALGLGIVSSDNVAAAAKTLDWGRSFDLSSADFGNSWEEVDGLAYTNGGASVRDGIAWTYANSDQGSATRHSYLYSVFTATDDFSGTVWCTLTGEYYADASATFDPLGVGDAYVYFYLWVKTASGVTVEQEIISYVIRWSNWDPAYLSIGPAQFEIDGYWTAVPGETYNVFAYVLGHASSITDAYSNGYYLKWNLLEVVCQVPPGFGGRWDRSSSLSESLSGCEASVPDSTGVLMVDETIAPTETLVLGDSIGSSDAVTVMPAMENSLGSKKGPMS